MQTNATMNSTNDNMPIYRAVPQLARLREEVLLADVWNQPELSYRDRILVTCSVLAATGKLEELKHWARRGVENGIALDELRGLVVQVALYAGWPAGLCAGKAVLALFERESQQQPWQPCCSSP